MSVLRKDCLSYLLWAHAEQLRLRGVIRCSNRNHRHDAPAHKGSTSLSMKTRLIQLLWRPKCPLCWIHPSAVDAGRKTAPCLGYHRCHQAMGTNPPGIKELVGLEGQQLLRVGGQLPVRGRAARGGPHRGPAITANRCADKGVTSLFVHPQRHKPEPKASRRASPRLPLLRRGPAQHTVNWRSIPVKPRPQGGEALGLLAATKQPTFA